MSPRWPPWRLLYYDSWLPRASRVISQAGLLSNFSAGYLMELAGRFVSAPVVAMLAVAGIAFFVVARFVRTDVFVVAALLALALFQATPRPQGAVGAVAAAPAAGDARDANGKSAAPSPDALLKAFYEKEALRAVAFPKPPEGSTPFDLVFVHVCSLSWDDLQSAGLEQHPLLKRFDLVLRRFNSVSTYSGPSAIRILRAGCGQTPHKALYAPAQDHCLLMPGLEKAGFETQLVLNHDGHFDDFLAFVKGQGVTAAPMPIDGIPAPQRSFDESKIHDDLAVLSRWLETGRRRPRPAWRPSTIRSACTTAIAWRTARGRTAWRPIGRGSRSCSTTWTAS